MTEKARKGLLLDLGLSAKACILENPYTIKLKRDGEDYSDVIEIF